MDELAAISAKLELEVAWEAVVEGGRKGDLGERGQGIQHVCSAQTIPMSTLPPKPLESAARDDDDKIRGPVARPMANIRTQTYIPPYAARRRRWSPSPPRRRRSPSRHRRSPSRLRRSPSRHRHSPSHHRRSPSRHRRSPSPRHRSPSPRYRRRSPPPKRLRLGNHSISDSPPSPPRKTPSPVIPEPPPPSRGRSHSPPKGPRAFQWRKSSKTPPKGPRNLGSSTPSTAAPVPVPVPASAPAPAPVPTPPSAPYPTAPRADRRPKDQPESSHPLHSAKYTSFPSIPPERWTQIPNFTMPDMSSAKSETEVSGLLNPTHSYLIISSLQMRRMQTNRISLNKDLDVLKAKSRRALHEVDMANIDLRMAQGRRKVASAQAEKAKQGTLGIDYIPPAPES